MASEPRLPKYVDDYAVLQPLYRGRERLRFAVRREPQEHPRLYLLKIFPPVPEGTVEGERERYVPRLTRGLSHRNLVESYQVGESEGLHYLVMEYVLSVDLGFVLSRCREQAERVPLGVALCFGREICRGLAFLHGFGADRLLHGRLAPAHVLLAYSGQVKLAHVHRLIRAGSTTYVEQEGDAPVADYQAPELLEGRPVDQRADVFAVGAILWESLAGKRFALGEDGTRERILAEGAKNLGTDNPEVPAAVVEVISRALRPQPEDRFRSAVDLGRRLDALLEQHCPGAGGRSTSDWLVVRFREEFRARRRTQQQLLADKRAETSSHRVSEVVPGEGVQTGDLVGQELDHRYRIQALIGEGGMGQVYEAEHVQLGKRLAVKVLHPLYSTEEEVVERFRREARSASSIGHPNIVNVTDSGTSPDGRAYFVMELLDGMELADVITQEGPLDYERAVDIAIQVCQALGAAHRAGIIHRDMKPENVFLTTVGARTDVVKILDFGIAKSARMERVRGGQLTEPGLAVGTPEYMAPEQAAGKPPDPRFDIYAVGGILYAVLTGRPPHRGNNVMEILTRKATRNSTPPRSYRPDIPVELERVIMMALSRNPERRPQTMEEFEYELRKSLQGRPDAVAHMLGISDALSLVQREQPRGSSSGEWPVEPPLAEGELPALEEESFRARPTLPESGEFQAIELADLPGAVEDPPDEDPPNDEGLDVGEGPHGDRGYGGPPEPGPSPGLSDEALFLSTPGGSTPGEEDGSPGGETAGFGGGAEGDRESDDLSTTAVYVSTAEILAAEEQEAEAQALRLKARRTLMELGLGAAALVLLVWLLWPSSKMPPGFSGRPGARAARVGSTRGPNGAEDDRPEPVPLVGTHAKLPPWRPSAQARARWKKRSLRRWIAFSVRAARDKRYLAPPGDCVAHGLKKILVLAPKSKAIPRLRRMAERALVARARRDRARGRYEEADQVLRGLLALAPKSRRGNKALVRLLVTRARHALRGKQVDEAERFVKEALQMDPEGVDPVLVGAEILEARDQRKDALAAYRKVLKAHRGNREARRAVRRLKRLIRRRGR